MISECLYTLLLKLPRKLYRHARYWRFIYDFTLVTQDDNYFAAYAK